MTALRSWLIASESDKYSGMQPAQQKIIAGVVVAAVVGIGAVVYVQHEHKLAKAATTKPTTAHASGNKKPSAAPANKHHHEHAHG